MDYFTIRRIVEFVRAQGAQDVRLYISNRAEELGMSIQETVQDLEDSAIDLWIDRQGIITTL